MQPRRTEAIPRLCSLDVFRGITIVLMIIVNSPGNSKPYGWLVHSAWDGCTLADIVFPFFIIIVGISAVIALSNLQAKGLSSSQILEKVLWRSATIFLLGLLLNAFPHHLWDLSGLRFMGVLQRIAICYFVSALLFLTTSKRTQVCIAWGLLLGYAFTPLMLSGDLVGYIDRLFLSPNHLYTPKFDPEGLLSTLPAIASVLFGNLIGFQLISSQSKKQKLCWSFVSGMLLALLGWRLNVLLPINKSLWSSSYVLWTTGIFLLSFGLVYALIELKGWERWSKFFNLFGRHALLVYLLHVFFLKVQAMIRVYDASHELVSLRVYITNKLFGFLEPPNAALCYAVGYMLLWLLVLLGVDKWKGKAASSKRGIHGPRGSSHGA